MGDQSRPTPVTGYPAGQPNGYPYTPAQYGFNHNNPNPYGQPHHNVYDASAVQRAIYLRRILAMFLACFLLSGTLLFIVWLLFRPQLPEFRVDSLSVSNFNLSGNFLSAELDMKFTARNPNKKMTVNYEDIQASVVYGDSKVLAGTSIAPFSQGTKSETASKATFSASGTFVDDWFVKEINQDKSNVEFDVIILTRVWFKAKSWTTKSRILRAYCRDLTVQLFGNTTSSRNHAAQRIYSGNLARAPKQCRVGF